MNCPSCGAKDVQALDTPYHFTECGLDWVYLVGLQHGMCPGCGDEVVNLPNPEMLFDRIAKTIIERKRVLRGNEIRFLRGMLGWTQDQLGVEIGKERLAIARWEAGKSRPAVGTDLILRAVWVRAYFTQVRENNLDRWSEEALCRIGDWISQIGKVIQEMRRSPLESQRVSIDVNAGTVVTSDC